MTALLPNELPRYSDRLRLRDGRSLDFRFVAPEDAGALQSYFRAMSVEARYNRFLGAASELPHTELEKTLRIGESDRFAAIAVMGVGGAETLIGEARYAFDRDSRRVEFGLSVADRWRGQGVAAALMSNLQCRAAAFGADVLFGDALRSNRAMIGLALKSGFALQPSADDWKLVRFDKRVAMAPQDIPCASWRLAAELAQPALAQGWDDVRF